MIMKKIAILLIIAASNLFSQATLYTPNGKAFQTYNANWQGTYNEATYEADKVTLYGSGNLYANSHVVGDWENYIWEYNCHVFAWNNWQGAERWNSENDMWKLGKPSPLALYWKDYPDIWYTDASNPSGIVSYITANQNQAAIVTYKKYGDITHSARIVGNGTRYISRWGKTHIVNHPPTEVPIGYGSEDEYYKINPAYRAVGTGDPVGRNWGTINNSLNSIQNGGYIKLYSGTYNETINTSTDGITISGENKNNTTINGKVTFQNTDDCKIEKVKVNDEIRVNSSNDITIYNNC